MNKCLGRFQIFTELRKYCTFFFYFEENKENFNQILHLYFIELVLNNILAMYA